jgi:predicted nucleotidyltransferase
MRYALKREAVHYTTALATAHALGIRGAADAQQATEWMVAQRRRRRAAYRVARHEEIRAYQRAYYAAHREEILARKAARRESPSRLLIFAPGGARKG